MSEEHNQPFNEESSSADSQADATAIFFLIVISVAFALLWVSNQ